MAKKEYFAFSVGTSHIFNIDYGVEDDIEEQGDGEESYEVILEVDVDGELMDVKVLDINTDRTVKRGSKRFDSIVKSVLDTAKEEGMDDLKDFSLDDIDNLS